ncbi:MAG TPA: glycosyltransferase family 2 protein [Candidatus Saccharimonadales bacterium]|jgi:cellulose synthase/poly-beta-1,6-N-acetylglucosamine synthase-like glycosyltransferase
MSKRRTTQSKLMHRFSRLAGPFEKLSKYQRNAYTVEFVSILSKTQPIYRYWAKILSYGALLLTIAFAVVLFQPEHWIINQQPNSPTKVGNIAMLVCLALLQIFAILGTISATRSTLRAKDPVPVRPLPGLQVAFATTRAPGEPISMVESTLQSMLRVRYARGKVDVWLLDETGDASLQEICRKLNVKYFSRAGVPEWNTLKQKHPLLRKVYVTLTHFILHGDLEELRGQSSHDPFFAAKSKHGNFNSWMQYIQSEGIEYDILAGVDTDQVPEQNYLERLLGYFRDRDVAYAVGPQVYGNYSAGLKGLVARWAESQASFFQSTIQRAGNDSQSAMFVGTNYAVRMTALRQINGFQPCITEDMATGLAIHTTRNPQTGNRWKSVYTPDVLARGEGPDFWGPYFTQQWRWAAGTFDTWKRTVWRVFFKLSPKAMLHYFLILTYYPLTALTWLLASISSIIYLTTGSTAILAPWSEFLSLYAMTLVMQLSLYFWNRQNNVSPHEAPGSYGVAGMAISSLTAPIYLSALIGIIIGKKSNFVVTTKGGSDNPDWFPSFRTHLQWAGILGIALIFGVANGHNHPAMLLWAGILVLLCLIPFVLGMSLAAPERFNKYTSAKQFKTEDVPHV